MPATPVVKPDRRGETISRVLVTGFGKFRGYEKEENPSWLAVSKLHNLLLEPDDGTEPIYIAKKTVFTSGADRADGTPRKRLERTIHITALKMPVTYDAVLSAVPGFHARPPVLSLPPGNDPDHNTLLSGPPPEDGYDFILHVGVGMAGGLKIEQLAHKVGYAAADADGKLAPAVSPPGEDDPGSGDGDEEKVKKLDAILEQRQLGGEHKTHRHISDANLRLEDLGPDAPENVFVFDGKARVITKRPDQVTRGFGKGYEGFPEVLKNDMDTMALFNHLFKLNYKHVQPSTNAGLYLCEFIYYCTLAEQRRAKQQANAADKKKTKVLFVHCPPVGLLLKTEEVVDGLKKIIQWVINEDVNNQ